MNNELRQQANEAADRMARAGMTLSAGIMQGLIAEAQRLGEENVALADYIRFLEMELMQAQVGKSPVLDMEQELGGENPHVRELPRSPMVLAGEINN
jgi:hypothetical protein